MHQHQGGACMHARRSLPHPWGSIGTTQRARATRPCPPSRHAPSALAACVHAAKARRLHRLVLRAHSHTKEPLSLTQLQSSRAVALLSNLASSWSKIASRLPASGLKQMERILAALKLSLSWLDGLPSKADGRTPSTRSVQLAATLAELSAAGLPLDADAIAAGILLEAADVGYLDYDTINNNLGGDVAMLVRDVMRVRTAPQRLQLYDDRASSALREWCVAFNDVRANVVEVVSRWDELHHIDVLPLIQRQTLAMEALQVYAPLGHALGLGAISSSMEDICFKELFPEPYNHTAQWLEAAMEPAERALYAAQQQLLAALSTHPTFSEKASGCVLRTRTKSLFSMMKKMVRLSKQGKHTNGQVFDLLGIRAIVQPREDLPPAKAEAAAVEACYIIESVAKQLWQIVPERTKDYIARPKANGYRSVHLTVHINSIVLNSTDGSLDEEQGEQVQAPSMESNDADSGHLSGGTSSESEDASFWTTTSGLGGSSHAFSGHFGGHFGSHQFGRQEFKGEADQVWGRAHSPWDAAAGNGADDGAGDALSSSSESRGAESERSKSRGRSRNSSSRGASGWDHTLHLDLHAPQEVLTEAEVVDDKNSRRGGGHQGGGDLSAESGSDRIESIQRQQYHHHHHQQQQQQQQERQRRQLQRQLQQQTSRLLCWPHPQTRAQAQQPQQLQHQQQQQQQQQRHSNQQKHAQARMHTQHTTRHSAYLPRPQLLPKPRPLFDAAAPLRVGPQLQPPLPPSWAESQHSRQLHSRPHPAAAAVATAPPPPSPPPSSSSSAAAAPTLPSTTPSATPPSAAAPSTSAPHLASPQAQAAASQAATSALPPTPALSPLHTPPLQPPPLQPTTTEPAPRTATNGSLTPPPTAGSLALAAHSSAHQPTDSSSTTHSSSADSSSSSSSSSSSLSAPSSGSDRISSSTSDTSSSNANASPQVLGAAETSTSSTWSTPHSSSADSVAGSSAHTPPQVSSALMVEQLLQQSWMYIAPHPAVRAPQAGTRTHAAHTPTGTHTHAAPHTAPPDTHTGAHTHTAPSPQAPSLHASLTDTKGSTPSTQASPYTMYANDARTHTAPTPAPSLTATPTDSTVHSTPAPGDVGGHVLLQQHHHPNMLHRQHPPITQQQQQQQQQQEQQQPQDSTHVNPPEQLALVHQRLYQQQQQRQWQWGGQREHAYTHAHSDAHTHSHTHQQQHQPFTGQGSEAAVAFLELQIRTQAMDDRAESGMAAHSAYKGGLDYQQARQLQMWVQELQHRLAMRPQKKLLLPPSITARHVHGRGAALESVDPDVEDLPLCWDVQASPATSDDSSGRISSEGGERGAHSSSSRNSSSGSGSTNRKREGRGGKSRSGSRHGGANSAAGAVAEVDVIDVVDASGAKAGEGAEHDGGQEGAEDRLCVLPSEAGITTNPAEVLFSFIDENNDGRMSVDELRRTLAELSSSRLPWASAQASSSSSASSSLDAPAGFRTEEASSVDLRSSSSSSSSSPCPSASVPGSSGTASPLSAAAAPAAKAPAAPSTTTTAGVSMNPQPEVDVDVAAPAAATPAAAPAAAAEPAAGVSIDGNGEPAAGASMDGQPEVDVDVAGLVQLVASSADGAEELTLSEFVELLRKARQAHKLKAKEEQQ